MKEFNIETFNKHRRNDPSNSQEIKNYETACEYFKNYRHFFDMGVFGSDKGFNPNDFLSCREEQIVFSLIQWLGTHVGQSFLRECGYEVIDKNNRR